MNNFEARFGATPTGEPGIAYDKKYLYIRPFRRLPAAPMQYYYYSIIAVVVTLLGMHGIVVPWAYDWPVMQALANHVESWIPGLSSAAAATDFEEKARVAIALDRVAVVPLVIFAMLILNPPCRIPRHPRDADVHSDLSVVITATTFVIITARFYLWPVPGDPHASPVIYQPLYQTAHQPVVLTLGVTQSLMSVALGFFVTILILGARNLPAARRLRRQINVPR